jgi:hypothetical protein
VEIVKDQGELFRCYFLMKIVLCMYLTLESSNGSCRGVGRIR